MWPCCTLSLINYQRKLDELASRESQTLGSSHTFVIAELHELLKTRSSCSCAALYEGMRISSILWMSGVCFSCAGFPWGHASCLWPGLIVTPRSCLLHRPFLPVEMSSPVCCFALPESACKLCQLLPSTALGKSKSSSFWFVVWLSCWGNPPHRLFPGELCLEKMTFSVGF